MGKELKTYIAKLEEALAIWESVRSERDIPALHDRRLQELYPAIEKAKKAAKA